MKYLLHKHCFIDGWFSPLQGKTDVCESMVEAVETFREAFRHLLGRKPTGNQVERVCGFGVVKGRSGSVEYRFCVTKQER